MMVAIAQNAMAASGDEGIALVRKERVDKFNAGKIEALVALYSADAVLLTEKESDSKVLRRLLIT
ncbi:MAG TPA: hypothetical protein VNV86_16425 [Candidatus Acidoferrum sp.]|jgi:hypothetical protein|nr:hypothetical protein [Candidatus Acidoferrum sp.]